MTNQLLRLPERLTDGVIVLDGHVLADAQAHWEGEDAEMMRRFDSSRKATVDEIRGAMQRWMDGRTNGGPMLAYAMRVDGVLAGGSELRWLDEPEGALYLSYWSYPRFRGRGLVGRAVALMLKVAATLSGARQSEAHVDADNIASRRVAEGAGFVEAERWSMTPGPARKSRAYAM